MFYQYSVFVIVTSLSICACCYIHFSSIMPPNLDDNSFSRASPNIQLFISALPQISFNFLSDDDENDALSDTDSDKEEFIAENTSSNAVSLEHNLRALLVTTRLNILNIKIDFRRK